MSVVPERDIKVLVVDDEANHAQATAEILERVGYDVTVATSGENAIKTLGAQGFDLVITDLVMKPMSGIDLMRSVKQLSPATEVILMSGHGSVEQAVEAIKLGAANYFTKPLDLEEVRDTVREVVRGIVARRNAGSTIEVPSVEENGSGDPEFPEFVGASDQLQRVFDTIRKVAPTPATVLVTGANGTGKEMVARAIHRLSPRSDEPFVALNCGALSETILESELFGHVKGAFTGAEAAREGHFETADKGTIFLDEIGDMPLSLQVKLLRVIQEREVTRLGSSRATPIDVRIIAATNRHLLDEVKQGNFREDLYYRLNVVQIAMPDLKDRRVDIPPLVARFIRDANRSFGRNVERIQPEALQLLMNFDWPGNVRQLRNCIETMIVLSTADEIIVEDIPDEITGATSKSQALAPLNAFDGLTLARVEEYMIRFYLQKFDGNRAKAAAALGISERTLYRKLKEYGLSQPGS